MGILITHARTARELTEEGREKAYEMLLQAVMEGIRASARQGRSSYIGSIEGVPGKVGTRAVGRLKELGFDAAIRGSNLEVGW